MTLTENLSFGIAGTATSATGAALSVTEVQAIVSIIVTVAGFIIGVLIPAGINIYNKIKKAKEDGKITPEEAKDIANTVKEEGEKIIESAKEAEASRKEKEKK